MAKKKEKIADDTETVETEVTQADAGQTEENTGPTPEETITKLQGDIEASKKREKEAEDRATRLEQERGDAVKQSAATQQSAVQMHEQALQTSLEAANTTIATIEQQLEDALNVGDSKKIVELNKKLASESVRLADIEKNKVQFERWKETQKNAPQANDGGYSSATKDWIAKHPEFNNDPKYKAKAIGAHSEAVSLGYKPDTAAYFEFIDGKLDSGEVDIVATQTASKQQTKMPSAAPSRDNGTVTGKREGGKVATARDIEAAETVGMSIGEYMKYKEQCEKEGLLK